MPGFYRAGVKQCLVAAGRTRPVRGAWPGGCSGLAAYYWLLFAARRLRGRWRVLQLGASHWWTCAVRLVLPCAVRSSPGRASA